MPVMPKCVITAITGQHFLRHIDILLHFHTVQYKKKHFAALPLYKKERIKICENVEIHPHKTPSSRENVLSVP